MAAGPRRRQSPNLFPRGGGVISRLVDWWLARRGEKRVPDDTPLILFKEKRVEVPVEVIREVPVEVVKEVYKYPVDLELVESARILSAALEHTTHDGEWKRHQVYAHLLKHYPNAKRRDIALAIEYALRESNG